MDSYLQKLEKWIEETPTLDRYLTILEQHLHVKKTIILAILSAILVLSLASGFASQLVCTSIGCLYPAYASIKALGNICFFVINVPIKWRRNCVSVSHFLQMLATLI